MASGGGGGGGCCFSKLTVLVCAVDEKLKRVSFCILPQLVSV